MRRMKLATVHGTEFITGSSDMRIASTVGVLILSVSAIASVQAQQPATSSHPEQTASPGHTGSGSGHKAGMAQADRDGADPAKFVTKAAQGGLTEVALSKAAKASSQDPKIKQFADQMLADHGKAN